MGAALEALMHQVKLLSEKNRLLEEKMLEYNGSSKKKTITDDNVNVLQMKPPQNNNLRSTSTATVQSVQSITSAVVPAAHHPNPKRSPMSVKSPNPKTVTGSGGGGAQKGIVPHHQLPSPFARENEQQQRQYQHVRQSSGATTSSMVSNVNVNNQNNNSEEEECFMSPEPTRPY